MTSAGRSAEGEAAASPGVTWLAAHRDHVPEPLQARMERATKGAGPTVATKGTRPAIGDDNAAEALLAGALAMVTEALESPERSRETAFRLLTADALLTAAAQAAAESADTGAEFTRRCVAAVAALRGQG